MDTGNIGKIERWLIDPCLPSAQVIIWSAATAYLHLFISLLTLSQHKIGKKLIKGAARCAMDYLLDEASEVGPSLIDEGFAMAWDTLAIAKRANFYFAIASMGSRFLIDWSSQVMAMTHCHIPANQERHHSTSPDLGWNDDCQWWLRPEWTNDTYRVGGRFGQSILLRPGESGSITMGLKPPRRGDGSAINFAQMISCRETGQIYSARSPDTIGNDPKLGLITHAHAHNNTSSDIHIDGRVRTCRDGHNVVYTSGGFCSTVINHI